MRQLFNAFCPWTGAPYKDKFTYFSREKDLNESKNSGFFDMGKGRFKVRLEGKVFTSSLDPAEKKMPKEITALIKAARNSIPI